MDNRPISREKYVTEGSKGVKKRGDGGILGGSASGSKSSNGRKGSSGGKGGKKSSDSDSSGGGLFKIIIFIIVLLLGGGGGLLDILDDDADGYSSANTGWIQTANTGNLDETVVNGARDKKTVIKGKGKDTVTIMVYMCGTDLESENGMATSDIVEMTEADISDKVNLLIYTGGCKKWDNKIISNKVNQIYQVKNNGIVCVNKNAGNGSMTNPDTLSSFISWCNKKYPANRKELIMWDHGGGSVTGYGYDEKNKKSGSMTLSGIEKALKKSKVSFDFIGFDACLMATVENGLMLNKYADYMIASEETEPGVGWYYTKWLTKLSKNTSMPTIEIGKNIVDDFISECNSSCGGQKTTLSVTDLAELSYTVPKKLKKFASSTSKMINNDDYKIVSDARYNAREFAKSSEIDQIDLVNMALNMNNDEGKDLADALLGAVKYNNTSKNMTNAYGLSIFFPYRSLETVDSAVATYKSIGIDDEYSKCIKQFASVETAGQAVTGGDSSPMSSLLGTLMDDEEDSLDISDILAEILADEIDDSKNMSNYIEDNKFDASALKWQEEDGENKIILSESQWSLVHDLALNMFYDDGKGYVDLGLDNVFKFDDDGNLLAETDRTWLAVNNQPVAYYYQGTVEDGDDYTITGYIPAFLNKKRVKLIVVFDNENPKGYIAGASYDYAKSETATVPKSLTQIKKGDKLDFICDYYSYKGNYESTYYLGDTMKVGDKMVISNTDVGEGKVSLTYRFTDIYNQSYWSEAITK